MFSVITNIYNKKTKRPNLMEFITATEKLKFFFLSFFLSPHKRVCGNNLNILSMCAVSPVVHTSNISSCQKKKIFSFPVAMNNSIKISSLVFLL